MKIIIFFAIVLLFSLGLTAFDKISSYKRNDKSVWQDGDSVHIKRNGKENPRDVDGFMKRLS